MDLVSVEDRLLLKPTHPTNDFRPFSDPPSPGDTNRRPPGVEKEYPSSGTFLFLRFLDKTPESF